MSLDVWGVLPLAPVGGSAPGPCQGLRPWTPLGAPPPNSSQRSLCVAAKAASFNSLAHWASASLFPPLAALGSAPLPLLKKAGENQLENFFGFPAKYAGPPLMGSGGLVLFVGGRGRKGVADGSFGRQKTATARGGRRRLAARGPKGPRACQTKKQGPEAKPRPCFSGRFAPRRRPRAPQRLPPPPRRRTSGGPMAVAHGKQGDGTDPGVLSPNAKRQQKRRRSNRPQILCL